MYNVLGNADEDDLDALESAARPPDLAIALLGKIGSGKSSLGNALAGYEAFEARKAASGVTREGQTALADNNGGEGSILVLDTPGFDPSGVDAGYVQALRSAFVENVPQKTNVALLFCIPLTGPIQADLVALELLEKKLFGPNMTSSTIVLWTHAASLDGATLESFFGSDVEEPTLSRILSKMHHEQVAESRSWPVESILHKAKSIGQPLGAVWTGAVATGGRKKQRRQRQLEAGYIDNRAPGERTGFERTGWDERTGFGRCSIL
jgi:predicted GTPase